MMYEIANGLSPNYVYQKLLESLVLSTPNAS